MSEPNLYKRGETYWLRANVNGSEIRESLRTGDLKAARRARDKRLEELKAAAFRGEWRGPWTEAVARWADHAIDQIRPMTAKRYAVSFVQVESVLAPLTIERIDGQTIVKLIEKRRRDGATPATIRRDLTAVSRVLDYAEQMGWREGNPALAKRKMLREKRDPIALPRHEDIEAVIAAASPRFGALIRAAWLTGCRQNELVTATWRAFNGRSGTLMVIGKWNKRRTISLSSEARRLIAEHPRTLGSDLIFCREDGEPYAQAASDFTHIRREAMKRGAGRFRFHDLRHLFAVEALRGGMSIYDLQKHLGHSSISVTELYLEFLTPDEVRTAQRGSDSAQKSAQ
jgi:integrase/recombinase XerD